MAGLVGLCATFSVSATSSPPPIIVLNSLDASVSILDPVNYGEIRRIPTGKEPHHLYLTPDEKSLLVANAASDSLTFLDPATGEVQRTLTGIVDPYHLRFSPDMKWFVTAANRLDHIDIYQWDGLAGTTEPKPVRRIPAGRTPSHLAIDSKSRNLYVSLQDSDQLIAIDLPTQTPVWTIPVGKTPADVYLTRDDRYLLVALTGDAYVEVYDLGTSPAQLVKRLATGAGAHAFRAQGDGRHVFVSNRVANTISRIDLQAMTVVDTYPAPGGPDCMELLADGTTILVTSRWSKKLTVIDTTRKAVIKQAKVGRSPHGVWTLAHAPRQ
ncbi:MAG: YncE family protein [Pigmentiphaga sp.]|nr:YncE family protein [Pigmentiphaga sp.]MDX3905364.1 YncE family protein [Pigmentiphaga sp.]